MDISGHSTPFVEYRKARLKDAVSLRARGYFGVAVVRPKHTSNLGTLWRSAHCFGAAFLAVIAERYAEQASDTTKATRHIPLYTFDTFAKFKTTVPQDCSIIGVEIVPASRDLVVYRHPIRAVYVLGPEDGSLDPVVLEQCASVVHIPSRYCLNLAVAGSIVLYDRVAKSQVPAV